MPAPDPDAQTDAGRRAPRVLVVLDTPLAWAVLIVESLLRHGCTVDLLCARGYVAAQLRGIRHVKFYGWGSTLAATSRAVRSEHYDRILPCTDTAYLHLMCLREIEPECDAILSRHLGPLTTQRLFSTRYGALRRAQELGIRVPETALPTGDDDLRAWYATSDRRSVLKADYSEGGRGVRIVEDLGQARAARAALIRRPGVLRVAALGALQRAPLAAWGAAYARRQPQTPLIQQYIDGTPANALFHCEDGRVDGALAVAATRTLGRHGMATAIRLIDDPDMLEAGRLLARDLNVTGFMGLDFMLEKASDKPYLLEVNPRCTQIAHLEIAGRGSLTGRLAASLAGRPLRILQPIEDRAIATFFGILAQGAPRRGHYHLDAPSDPAIAALLQRAMAQARNPLRRALERLLEP